MWRSSLAVAFSILFSLLAFDSALAGPLCQVICPPSGTITDTGMISPGYAGRCYACLPAAPTPSLPPGITPAYTPVPVGVTPTALPGCFYPDVEFGVLGETYYYYAPVLIGHIVTIEFGEGPIAIYGADGSCLGDCIVHYQGETFTAEHTGFIGAYNSPGLSVLLCLPPSATSTPSPIGNYFAWIAVPGSYVHVDDPNTGHVQEGEYLPLQGVTDGVCSDAGYTSMYGWAMASSWHKTTGSTYDQAGHGGYLSADGSTVISPSEFQGTFHITISDHVMRWVATIPNGAYGWVATLPPGYSGFDATNYTNPTLADPKSIWVHTYDWAGTDPNYQGQVTTVQDVYILCHSLYEVVPTPAFTPTPTFPADLDCSIPEYIDPTAIIGFEPPGVIAYGCYGILPEWSIELPFGEGYEFGLPGVEICVTWLSVPYLEMNGLSINVGAVLAFGALVGVATMWLRMG